MRIATQAKAFDVPLIELESLGFSSDTTEVPRSDTLGYVDCGREAAAFVDPDRPVIYKLFDLKIDSEYYGSMGLKLTLEGQPDGKLEIVELDATLEDILDKICILHDAGACPTEIVGLSSNGSFLIVKQPKCLNLKSFRLDRIAAVEAVRAVAPTCSFGGRELWILYMRNQHWLLCDLHEKNIMRLPDGSPTIIDALIGWLDPYYINLDAKISEAAEKAVMLARGFTIKKVDLFQDTRDEDL